MKPRAIILATATSLLWGCVQAEVEAPRVCSEEQISFESTVEVTERIASPRVTMTSSSTVDLAVLHDLQKYGSLELSFKEGFLKFAAGQLASLEMLYASIQTENAQAQDQTTIMNYVLPEQVRGGSEIDLGSAMDTGLLLSYLQAGPIRLNYKATISGTAWKSSQVVQSRICVSAIMHLKKNL